MSGHRPITAAEFSHPISAHIAPIFSFEDEHGYVAGTAVLIAPGLALTARHVIESLFAHFNRDAWKGHNTQFDISIAQANLGAYWHVVNTYAWIGSDIAVLALRPGNDVALGTQINRLPMTVDPPVVGSEVTALGYPHTEIVLERHNITSVNIALSVTPTVSVGKVLEVHASLRDSTLLSFPCFSADATFFQGMSGGAVFNEQRELCGLVCAGGEGELSDRSHGVSIWPSMIIPLTLPPDVPVVPGIELGRSYKIHDLAKVGLLNFRGYERIEFFKHENGSDGVRRRHW